MMNPGLIPTAVTPTPISQAFRSIARAFSTLFPTGKKSSWQMVTTRHRLSRLFMMGSKASSTKAVVARRTTSASTFLSTSSAERRP